MQMQMGYRHCSILVIGAAEHMILGRQRDGSECDGNEHLSGFLPLSGKFSSPFQFIVIIICINVVDGIMHSYFHNNVVISRIE